MSSVAIDSEAFADLKEEVVADEAAEHTKKKLGVLFWICVGFIVLVAFLATFANLLPLPNPDLGQLQQRAERRARAGATCSAPTISTATSSAA